MWGCGDVKMWRWEDVRMRRCEYEKMWRWEDVRMRRFEGEKMSRWEDVKMRRCFTVLQTPTIGRTLRSDALGKKAFCSAGLETCPAQLIFQTWLQHGRDTASAIGCFLAKKPGRLTNWQTRTLTPDICTEWTQPFCGVAAFLYVLGTADSVPANPSVRTGKPRAAPTLTWWHCEWRHSQPVHARCKQHRQRSILVSIDESKLSCGRHVQWQPWRQANLVAITRLRLSKDAGQHVSNPVQWSIQTKLCLASHCSPQHQVQGNTYSLDPWKTTGSWASI